MRKWHLSVRKTLISDELWLADISVFSCLRLRQWPMTYLITLSDWIMSCQAGRHAVVTVCEPD